MLPQTLPQPVSPSSVNDVTAGAPEGFEPPTPKFVVWCNSPALEYSPGQQLPENPLYFPYLLWLSRVVADIARHPQTCYVRYPCVTPKNNGRNGESADYPNCRVDEARSRQARNSGRTLSGLYLVIQPSGARSRAVRYRTRGRPSKHTIGRYPAIDLASARKLGSAALRAVAEGRDPGRERKQDRASKADSIELISAQFVERHCMRSNRPRTAQETARLLQLHVLRRWRGRTVHEITRRDVLNLLDGVVDGGAPIAANRVLSAVRKLFNWCAARDIIAASPCAGVKPPTAECSRDRVLNDGELRLVWQAAEKIGRPFGQLVQLLALTGQRRDEVAKIQWSEIDFEPDCGCCHAGG